MDANIREDSTPATPPADPGGNGLPKNLDELNRKRRGTKPGSTRGPYHKANGRPTPAPAVAAPSAAMFTPESVRPLVSLPFNMAFVKTGFEGFTLSEGEAATLSSTGAMVFNSWVAVDPKWLALITFSLSLASISVEKTMLYRRALAQWQAEQDRIKKEAPPAPAPAQAAAA